MEVETFIRLMNVLCLVLLPGLLCVAGVVLLTRKGRYRNAGYFWLYVACGLITDHLTL
jgi:hypothetical protein